MADCAWLWDSGESILWDDTTLILLDEPCPDETPKKPQINIHTLGAGIDLDERKRTVKRPLTIVDFVVLVPVSGTAAKELMGMARMTGTASKICDEKARISGTARVKYSKIIPVFGTPVKNYIEKVALSGTKSFKGVIDIFKEFLQLDTGEEDG